MHLCDFLRWVQESQATSYGPSARCAGRNSAGYADPALLPTATSSSGVNEMGFDRAHVCASARRLLHTVDWPALKWACLVVARHARTVHRQSKKPTSSAAAESKSRSIKSRKPDVVKRLSLMALTTAVFALVFLATSRSTNKREGEACRIFFCRLYLCGSS